ncbi:hypothetical protein T4B_7508 [Trichinella pseudospiralis]|uniref:Uncharacterized protein n=1 Tax=Trichinella pseudospiralis TaxID=6337 RepID=A0A0V1HJV8_TRIPS|nr:hypothetical protein T4E_11638 [Trichinella pseudospiralis]KRY73784.1 hypothetical protein T4A_5140 [Trichinella pseudospiralis]KRZ10743.1 hypothetical protein T4B_7508 [Trichinella pseudospiralis]KRZ37545.1 hypothetical protein T4C_9925 [Trichinella pseudospiralis]
MLWRILAQTTRFQENNATRESRDTVIVFRTLFQVDKYPLRPILKNQTLALRKTAKKFLSKLGFLLIEIPSY